ncbi:hypothetical protein SAMN04487914_108131 [Arthrobacter sp. ok909]|uniref:hypothetical protein n=1 Tax=Arthrobacter sp. ok909 TaxID=1761746 RepID=UPI0008866F4F|nr:hypothetical protein [Arthrobacter sp. ok909]SDP33998.1 hypothetical protein SAMN04487914_108131 [Arthrobacter sp. ok909]
MSDDKPSKREEFAFRRSLWAIVLTFVLLLPSCREGHQAENGLFMTAAVGMFILAIVLHVTAWRAYERQRANEAQREIRKLRNHTIRMGEDLAKNRERELE